MKIEIAIADSELIELSDKGVDSYLDEISRTVRACYGDDTDIDIRTENRLRHYVRVYTSKEDIERDITEIEDTVYHTIQVEFDIGDWQDVEEV